MRILLFFLLPLNLFFALPISASQQRTGQDMVYELFAPVITNTLEVGADQLLGLETRQNRALREQYLAQTESSKEQTITAQTSTKNAKITRKRERLQVLGEERAAAKKYFADSANKHKEKQKKITFEILNIEEEAIFEEREFRQKTKAVARDGKTYKEIANELAQLETDPKKNKDRIASLEKNKKEIKDEINQMKKERKEAIETRKKEAKAKIEKEDADKQAKKKNGEKAERTDIIKRFMTSINAIAEHACNRVDAIADKSVAHITKHDSFKDTFVELHAKMINRGLVGVSGFVLMYGMYKLYNKYTSNDYDIYDNDADDDEYDDE